jgi:hypothetical protein
MQIGIDFDNTIVSYDSLFHKIALEKNLIPHGIKVNKNAVRDYLREINNEDAWTELQGYVYGLRMNEANAYQGLLSKLKELKNNKHEFFIVSHKTQFPFMGPKYDLHEAAKKWIKINLQDKKNMLIDPGNVFFEVTKDAKIDRIKKLNLDFFIDDLPEILNHSNFPTSVTPILYDPEDNFPQSTFQNLKRLNNWGDLNFLINRFQDE